MSKVRPPLKLAVASFFLDNQPHSFSETLTAMQLAYPSEKYVSASTIELALQSLKAIGVIKEAKGTETDLCYCISSTGGAKVKKALGIKA